MKICGKHKTLSFECNERLKITFNNEKKNGQVFYLKKKDIRNKVNQFSSYQVNGSINFFKYAFSSTFCIVN
jgi:hypothetical protein